MRLWNPDNTESVKRFGAVGDGVTDDTDAIQRALSSSLGTVLFPKGTYLISDTLQITARKAIAGFSAKIQQATALKISLQINNANDVVVQDLEFAGLKTDYENTNSVHSASAIEITGGCERNLIIGGTFRNHAGNGIQASDVTDLGIIGCTIAGPGTDEILNSDYQYGTCIRILGTSSRVLISGCDLSEHTQGVLTAHSVNQLRIVGNAIHDIRGQHGIYLGGNSGVTITGNTFAGCKLHGIKLQLSSESTEDAVGVSISGNVLDGTGGGESHAILITNTGFPGNSYRCKDLAIVGNVIRGFATATSDGIVVQQANGCVVASNQINGGRSGVSIKESSAASVADNRVANLGRSGVRCDNSSDVAIRGNSIDDVASANFASDEFGIHLVQSGSGSVNRVVVDGNNIRDTGGNMRYGVMLSGTVGQSTVTVTNNQVEGHTDYGVRLLDPSAEIYGFGGNRITGSNKVENPPTSITTQPNLTYSRTGETTAEAALRSALSSLGLATDNTTA